MADFTHYAEPFPAHGGAVADVMAAATAAARLDRTTVLLREVLQNSCDARAQQGKPIEFLVHAFALSKAQAQYVRHEFADRKELPMAQALAQGEITGLLFADSNTVGLQGPIDAGEAHEFTNFTNFFFQVGRSADDGTSGGAFGLGRTVLFTYSQCRTAIVYSRFKTGKGVQSRLMAMSIGKGFEAGGRKHTGRHWWGKKNATPIEGDEADRIADLLGMGECLKKRTQTGTSVLILQPLDLTHREESEATSTVRAHDADSRRAMIMSLRRAAELYAWPQMLDSNAVSFEFKCDGETIPLRDIREDPVLGKFARAYEAQNGSDSLAQVSDIDFSGHLGKRGRFLGRLSWISGQPSPADEEIRHEEIISLHSVALMRQARFIVKYLNVGGIDGLTTRGVFVGNPNYEPTYRKAEPVTHDDWLPEKLGYPSGQRNEIKQTFSKIEARFKQSLGKQSEGSADLGPMPVEIANALGQIFAGEGFHGPRGGEGDNPNRREVTGSRKSKGLALEEINSLRVVNTSEAGSLVEFDFRIIGKVADESALPFLSFDASAFTADGTREHARAGEVESGFPRILKVTANGRDVGLAPAQVLESDLEVTFTVTVSCPAGLAVACTGKLEKLLAKA